MKLKKAEHLAFRKIAGQCFVVDIKSSVLHEMSDTASFLWEHINGKNSEQDLTEMLCGEYNIDIETAKKDVSELVATLKEFQLLEKC